MILDTKQQLIHVKPQYYTRPSVMGDWAPIHAGKRGHLPSPGKLRGSRGQLNVVTADI